MSISAGAAVFKLAFEISPIVFTGGIATNIPGGALPIVSITQAATFVQGLLSGGDPLDLNDFFAYFRPIPGGTLADNQVGTYPFANQAVAGNAIIAQPLSLSMLMICPARGELGWAVKLATMMALQSMVQQHTAAGGTFTIVTPAHFYTNGILTGLRDVTGSDTKQAQAEWQWDFTFPLLTLNQAQQAQNSLMAKLSAGTQVDGSSWSGLQPPVGNPASVASPGVVPAGAGAPATNTAPSSLPVPPPAPSAAPVALPDTLQT